MNMEKKEKRIVIITIFLAIIIVGLGIVLAITTERDKSDGKKQQEEYSSKELVGDEHRKYYFDVMEMTGMFNLNLAYDFPIEEVSKISDERKTQFILDILIGQGNSKLTYKDVEAEAKKYFYKFKPLKKTIKDIKNRVLYEYKDGSYIFKKSYGYDYFINFMPISDKAYDDRWIVEGKIYYLDFKEENGAYKIRVYDSKDKVKSDDFVGEFLGESYVLSQDDYKSIEGSLKAVKYTYKRIDGNYYLESVVIK